MSEIVDNFFKLKPRFLPITFCLTINVLMGYLTCYFIIPESHDYDFINLTALALPIGGALILYHGFIVATYMFYKLELYKEFSNLDGEFVEQIALLFLYLGSFINIAIYFTVFFFCFITSYFDSSTSTYIWIFIIIELIADCIFLVGINKGAKRFKEYSKNSTPNRPGI
jgi:hypothetical protein